MAMTLSAAASRAPVRGAGRDARRRAVRASPASGRRRAGSRSCGMGVEPGLSDVVRPLRRRSPVLDDRRGRRPRRRRPRRRRATRSRRRSRSGRRSRSASTRRSIWERDRGWYTTEPFSEPEMFEFPDGIGPVECVNVEHEEVVLVPRWVDCERVTFKYGLGDGVHRRARTLALLGLDSTEPVRVKGVEVAPRDVVAAVLPDPATLGDRMTGRTCAGTLVTGTGMDGAPRAVYLHHVVDNEETMARDGVAGGRLADGRQPGRRARAARRGRLDGRGRARPRGVRRRAVPRPAGRPTAARTPSRSAIPPIPGGLRAGSGPHASAEPLAGSVAGPGGTRADR